MSDITEWGPASSVVRVAVLIPDGIDITRHRLMYARGVQPEDEYQTNRYEGDDTSQSQDELLATNLTAAFDNLRKALGNRHRALEEASRQPVAVMRHAIPITPERP